MTGSPVSGAMPRGAVLDRARSGSRGIAVAALAAVLMLAAGTARATKPGDRASDFKLKDRAGKVVALRDLRGKIVVLDFWASWCGPCKKELPALDALAKEYAQTGSPVVVVAVNIDKDRAKADRTLKLLGLSSLTILFDPAGTSAGLYDLPSMPTSFVIDGKGIVRHVHAGYRPGDERGLRREIDALLAPPRP